MKRYLVAALAAGAVHALLGPLFVHFALDESLRQELERALAVFSGRDPAAGGSGGIGEFALHVVLRVLLGFLTVGVFVVLQRKRPRFKAARVAGAIVWVLGYVLWPIVLKVQTGMSTTLLFLSMGYGLVETQLAAHVGMFAWGRPKKPTQ